MVGSKTISFATIVAAAQATIDKLLPPPQQGVHPLA